MAKVAIQPVGFLHQHDAARLVIAQKAHHFAELLPTRRLGWLDVRKFSQDAEVVLPCIFTEEFELLIFGQAIWL